MVHDDDLQDHDLEDLNRRWVTTLDDLGGQGWELVGYHYQTYPANQNGWSELGE